MNKSNLNVLALLVSSLASTSSAFAQSRPLRLTTGPAYNSVKYTIWEAGSSASECAQMAQSDLAKFMPLDQAEFLVEFKISSDRLITSAPLFQNNLPMTEIVGESLYDQADSDQETCETTALDDAKSNALSECKARYRLCEVDETLSTVSFKTHKKFLGIFDHKTYSKCQAFASAKISENSGIKVSCSMSYTLSYRYR